MATLKRSCRVLLGSVMAALVGSAGPAWAADHPTIHHAGVLRSVEPSASVLVIDERVRLGPPRLTRIHVTEQTVLVRVRRADGEFLGERVPLDRLRVGEYLALRGVDQGDRHVAEMIWSLGPAD